jgi:2-polyprenyl-6-hydroxyphenyl methylase/3-demethylubiquinone-9 3-methyltransferase
MNMMGKEPRDAVTFSFGKNWEAFVENKFSEERVSISRKHLLDFLEVRDLQGAYFLDIGCGSGIHSLAALKSGASRIVSVDIDPHSVRTTERIRAMAGNPPKWEVLEGSILDAGFVARLDPADIVYSWGVLHHTGSLWEAMRNSAGLIRPGGVFYVALYEKTADSDHWIAVKKKYNRSSRSGKRWIEFAYVYRTFFRSRGIREIYDSLRYIMRYRQSRGMAFWTDVRDWLGGWPYEPATPREVTDFCAGPLGLRVLKVKTGEANVEYLCAKGAG